MNYKVTIAYDGTNFFGWAKQPNKRTIQQTIEDALNTTLGIEIKIIGSGRTDRGVHAMNQIFSFKIQNKNYNPGIIKRILIAKLPQDIQVKTIEIVEDDFHAQYSAKTKTYEYLISFKDHCFWKRHYHWELNFSSTIKTVIYKINTVLLQFIGTHDFLSFSTSELEQTSRTIYSAFAYQKENYIVININGDGFLKNMVRMIVAICVDYVNDKTNLNNIRRLLQNPKKGSSIKQAPPQGLFLKEVFY